MRPGYAELYNYSYLFVYFFVYGILKGGYLVMK